jgi:hypothetical protein
MRWRKKAQPKDAPFAQPDIAQEIDEASGSGQSNRALLRLMKLLEESVAGVSDDRRPQADPSIISEVYR